MGSPGREMGFGFGWLYVHLCWAVIIAAIVMAVKWFLGDSPHTHAVTGKSTRDLRAERFAHGEMGNEELDRKIRDLR